MILHDERRHTDFAVPPGGARLGRDPDLEVVFPEDETLVSAIHARVYRAGDGSWWLEDLGSTNGTWLSGRRLAGPGRLASGDRFTLGQRGPAIVVTLEQADAADPHVVLMDKPLFRLRRVAGGQDLGATAHEVVLGRAADCTVPLRTVADSMVSKHHAVVELAADGSATIRDLQSKNGTWVNGRAIENAVAPLALGDRVMLGWHGPLFEVRALGALEMAEGDGAAYHPEQEPARTVAGMVQVAGEEARGGSGMKAGVFVRALARQMATESSLTFRLTVLALMIGILASVGLVYREATRRTEEAAARLETAERVLSEQIRSASEAQARSEQEIGRLRTELSQARRAAVSRSVLDSLERRLREAETRASRPVAPGGAPGVDLSRLAEENQHAVGLVVARFGADSQMGSGFAITASGYFVTSRHVVRDPQRADPQSIEVTMADSRTPLPVDLVSVSTLESQGQDLAVLRIRNYRGPFIRALDWLGTGARQGAPAALIGFPGGVENAVDPNGFVRTTMFSGIIAQVTSEWVKFGGTTFSGVSGSPLFNADGVVIAIHYGGLREGPGLGFSVPVGRLRRWLPQAARRELGL